MTLPVLYSFRRCPYAMRARLALHLAGVQVELREIALKAKPPTFLALSPKATVPVLQHANGVVLEESLEIMQWALVQRAPHWLIERIDDQPQAQFVAAFDEGFKPWLDRYKYHRDEHEWSREHCRAQCLAWLQRLETLMVGGPYLCGTEAQLVDLALLPFVRQFHFVEPTWLAQQALPAVWSWLNHWLAHDAFLVIMEKQSLWQDPMLATTAETGL